MREEKKIIYPWSGLTCWSSVRTAAGRLSLCFFIYFSPVFVVDSPGTALQEGLPGFVNPQVTAATNIHFDKKYCTECHTEISQDGQTAPLRFQDFTISCRCHGYTPDTYTHPVDISLSPEKQKRIPGQYPLADGKITCVTCHDFRLQCRDDVYPGKGNWAFLRISPLLSRTAICYQCHDERKFRMLDPHNQLDQNGKIVRDKCLYCHIDIPDVQHASLQKKKWDDQLVHLIGNLDALCYRCHYKQTKQHPINSNHLKKPTARILRSMHWAEQTFGIVMPLDDSGKITCITCHNPHEKGVIPERRTASAGAGKQARLRLPKAADKICLACHSNK